MLLTDHLSLIVDDCAQVFENLIYFSHCWFYFLDSLLSFFYDGFVEVSVIFNLPRRSNTVILDCWVAWTHTCINWALRSLASKATFSSSSLGSLAKGLANVLVLYCVNRVAHRFIRRSGVYLLWELCACFGGGTDLSSSAERLVAVWNFDSHVWKSFVSFCVILLRLWNTARSQSLEERRCLCAFVSLRTAFSVSSKWDSWAIISFKSDWILWTKLRDCATWLRLRKVQSEISSDGL